MYWYRLLRAVVSNCCVELSCECCATCIDYTNLELFYQLTTILSVYDRGQCHLPGVFDMQCAYQGGKSSL